MLSDLFVRDFRCFAEAKVELHPDVTLLVGRNAQGKTSLMEAACVLLRLQSPRTTDRAELIRIGASTMVVEGVLDAHRLRCAQSASRRRLAIDEAVCPKSGDYLEASARVVWMDHRDMSLLRGGAEHRRRYLDFAASQLFPDYLKALRGYERALRGRNHVLKRDTIIAWRQADAFAQVMGEFAQVLSHRRAELVTALAPRVGAAHLHLSGSAEQAAMTYLPGVTGSLVETLAALREEEQRGRSTAAGPHRDELRLEINQMDATSFASEGQQRSLALSLKLAQAGVLQGSTGRAPLLLMDDVFGELDVARRRSLLGLLPQGTQKVITTTSLDWARQDELAGSCFTVEAASVVPNPRRNAG